jgi:hypothetical protein
VRPLSDGGKSYSADSCVNSASSATTHFPPLSTPDLAIVELFLLPNQSDSRCSQQKDLRDCGLDANECSKCFSLRAHDHGSTFLPRGTPRYQRFPESASTTISALYAFLVCAFDCRNAREPFQFVGTMERFQEDTILSRSCCILRAYAVPRKCNSGLQGFPDFFLYNTCWWSFQVVPLCVLGYCSRSRYHRHVLDICEVPLLVR